MKRGNAVPAALVLSAVLACSEPPAGSLPPPASPTPTLSATATPTQSADDSVAQAVRWYYAALQAAVQDPARNRADLEPLLDPSCPCREILAVLDREAEQGRYVDYTLSVSDVRVADESPTRATARVTVEQSSGRLYDSSGRVVERISAVTERYFVELRRAGEQWRVSRVSRVARR